MSPIHNTCTAGSNILQMFAERQRQTRLVEAAQSLWLVLTAGQAALRATGKGHGSQYSLKTDLT